tara:strand:+ start:2408 stop:2878 length:471 start_codon:yes stop_codon:yes gene_type:complete
MGRIITYENPWLFNGQPFNSEDIGNHVGFVYVIRKDDADGKSYIGRKYFWNIRKKPGAKKGARRIKKESDWKDYYGSSERLKEDVDCFGQRCFRREIISLHKTRGDVNYTETKLQFALNVLEDDKYYNDNILIKYKRRPEHIMEARVINDDWRRYF